MVGVVMPIFGLATKVLGTIGGKALKVDIPLYGAFVQQTLFLGKDYYGRN
jgi:hypothetical protein